MKKNKFSIVTPVDSYKFEFETNANTTFLKNIFDRKNLFYQNSTLVENVNNLNQNVLFDLSLADVFLKNKKSNFLEDSKSQFFKKDFLFTGLSEAKVFKQNFFKTLQPLTEKKKTPNLSSSKLNGIKLWSNTQNDAFVNFFKNEVLNNKKLTVSTIQHPDLDDETRTLKRNAGKTTPIRVLKHPNGDFFFSNSDKSNIELLRFRFNEKKPTLANKPVRPTVYLTFKQKRYNQRTNVGKKTTIFFDKELNKKQTYSGNPFLKDMSIIEENYGNPTRQYRMVKKAKSRLDTTRITG